MVRDFVLTQNPTKLSQAALETLAVIAYKQPISRGSIASIRAVNVDSVVRTLLGRGLISEAYTDSETGAIHYETTDLLLTQLGINSLDELPHISPLLVDGSDGFDELGRCDERRHRDPWTLQPEPTGSACRRCSRRRASRPVGSASSTSPRAASRSTVRSSPSSAVASIPTVDLVAVDGVRRAARRHQASTSCSTSRAGVVSSMEDERGRPDLRQFTDDVEERVYNVGRLDADTTGLLLLTNDGALAHVLAHPSFGVTKTYIATVRGTVDRADHPEAQERHRARRRPDRRRQGEAHRRAVRRHEPRRGDAALGAQPHRAAHARGRRAPGARAGATPVRAAAPRKPRRRAASATSLGWNSANCSRSRASQDRPTRQILMASRSTPSEDRMNARMRGQVRIVGAGLLGASIGLGLTRARGRRDPRRRLARRTSRSPIDYGAGRAGGRG